jgi:hypothetical protein
MTNNVEFSPVKNEDVLTGLTEEIRSLIEDIARNHSASFKGFHKTGKLCVALFERLGTRPRREIMHYLQMDDATFSRYLSIGRLPDDLVAQLPHKLRVLYAVASMNAAEREAAAQDGLLTRELTAVQIEHWKREKRGSETRETGKVLATIIDPDDPSKRTLALEQLNRLASEGVEVSYPEVRAAKRKEASKLARDLQIVRALKERFGDISLSTIEEKISS